MSHERGAKAKAKVRERLVAIALALPEANRVDMGAHVQLRVRTRAATNKTFASFLDDHHGDGILGVVVKAPPGENERLVAAAPERFYRAAYLGAKGWVGVRLDADDVDWSEVARLVRGSYLAVAPKSLAARA